MEALGWEEARACVRRLVGGGPPLPVEIVRLGEAAGRVLAKDIVADRRYPPFSRSMRDGFAVRVNSLPGRLRVVGEVRAGEPATRPLQTGECIEIMTGAPVPEGADAILMVEHATRDGDAIHTDRSLQAGDNISREGCESAAGDLVAPAGVRLDAAHIAAAATVGAAKVAVFRRPRIAIISTGDELVGIEENPQTYQIRNSNSVALASQVARAGGEVSFTTIALDTAESLQSALEKGLEADLLLLSGGVSAGKYDLVEPALAEHNAEFFFTRVLIQPGQPSVFGRARGTFFFGLPGNPISTMVTFELFARLALQLIAGETSPRLPIYSARLSEPFRHKTGLTRFLPARMSENDAEVAPAPWQGSGDVFSVARANAFLVADADRASWEKGDSIRVLAR